MCCKDRSHLGQEVLAVKQPHSGGPFVEMSDQLFIFQLLISNKTGYYFPTGPGKHARFIVITVSW